MISPLCGFLTHTCLLIHPLVHRELLFKFRDVGIYRSVSIYIVQPTQSQQKNTNVQGVSIFFYLVFDHFCLLLNLIGLHIDHWSEIQNVTYQTKPQYLYYNMQINQKCLCLIVFISWRFSFGKTCLVYIHLNVCFCQITISCEVSFFRDVFDWSYKVYYLR